MTITTVCMALTLLQQDPQATARPQIRSQEELAVMVFLRSVDGRAHGDGVVARKWLPELFTDDEVSKLAPVAKEVAELFPRGSDSQFPPLVPASPSPVPEPGRRRVGLEPAGPRFNDVMKSRLGEELYRKLGEHAVSVIKMKSVPPPGR
jgi:hypothetical protein